MMMNYTAKKKNKINSYKAVRENIRLNNHTKAVIDLPKNFIMDDNLLFQFADVNLMNQLNSPKTSKKNKLVIKWWEN